MGNGPSILLARELFLANKSDIPSDIFKILETEGEWKDHFGNLVILESPDRRIRIDFRPVWDSDLKGYIPDNFILNVLDFRDHLTKLPTHELMNLKKRAYQWGYISIFDYSGPTFTLEEIKKELATREHIPNKQESKALRRAAAQGKRKTHKP